MRVAAVQHNIVWEDPKANFAALEPRIAAAAAAGARLVALTEMYATGFSMNTAVTAEPPGGPAGSFLSEQARRHGLWMAGSVAELPDAARRPGATVGDARPSNTLILAGPDGTQHRYRKLHPFSYSKENEHFAAGSEAVTVTVDGMRLSLFVCYDLRFADAFWELAPATDVYLVVANWPGSRRDHWRTLLRARAIENQAYVVGVNRVGAGGGLDYAGDSMVVDPMGERLVSAAQTETVLLCDLDVECVADTRERLPFMQDRR